MSSSDSSDSPTTTGLTGRRRFVFAFDADVYREFGYGFTGTTVHEVGHHIGMSHPHDGFDPETGVDFGAESEFFFAWAGDESDTVMHYLTLSNQFGEHNRDNMYRWEAAGYLNWANALAGAHHREPAGPASLPEAGGGRRARRGGEGQAGTVGLAECRRAGARRVFDARLGGRRHRRLVRATVSGADGAFRRAASASTSAGRVNSSNGCSRERSEGSAGATPA